MIPHLRGGPAGPDGPAEPGYPGGGGCQCRRGRHPAGCPRPGGRGGAGLYGTVQRRVPGPVRGDAGGDRRSLGRPGRGLPGDAAALGGQHPTLSRDQVRRDTVLTDRPGVVLGQRYTPIARVGICVPGSPAAFPSTILMNVIPAKIAGVGEIVVVTPPGKDGTVSPEALAAARIAGADRVFKIGGAQAVGGSGLRHGDRAAGGQDRGPRRHFLWPPPSGRCSAGWPST